MIAARGIGLARGGRELLRDVSLDLAAGEVVALVGPNGAGKSSLLRVMTGALRPDAGTVTWDGVPLARIGAAALARRRAVVSQQARLAFPMTVAEVAALGRLPWPAEPPGRRAALVAGALAQAEVSAGLRDRLYDSLSGGEQQRVQLARALAQIEAPPGPQALFLDEPSASLDPGHAAALLRLVRHLARSRGIAVLIVLHDLNQAAFVADRAVLLCRGAVMAQGPVPDVLTAEQLGALYGARFRVQDGLIAADFAALG